ncbi:MAG: DUF3343 domain-containing protein [Planctomycetes bacterium]|nr:DUF3343 domain-containing protein [Planctomycetota bacterium]
MGRFIAILVHSTSHAIQIERLLREAGLTVKLIPTPRHLSSDCGSAVRIDAAEQARCAQLLNDANVAIDRLEVLDA